MNMGLPPPDDRFERREGEPGGPDDSNALSKSQFLPKDKSFNPIEFGSHTTPERSVYRLNLYPSTNPSYLGVLVYTLTDPSRGGDASTPVRALAMPLSLNSAPAWVALVIDTFNSSSPAEFERFFTERCNAVSILEETQTAQRHSPVSWSEFRQLLGEPKLTLSVASGSLIKVYQDQSTDDVVITFSKSASLSSDCIAFRVCNSEAWKNLIQQAEGLGDRELGESPLETLEKNLSNALPLKDYRGFSQVIETLKSLQMETDPRRLFKTLASFICNDTLDKRGIFFPGREAHRNPLEQVMTKLPSSWKRRLVTEPPETDPLSISRDILHNQKTEVFLHNTISPDVALHFHRMSLTIHDNGQAYCALDVAHRAAGRCSHEPLEVFARLEYEFDMTDLSGRDQRAKIAELIRAFKNAYAGPFHGQLTSLLATWCSQPEVGAKPFMREVQRSEGLEWFKLDTRQSLDLFVTNTTEIFASCQPRLLCQNEHAAVIEVRNNKGDRLHLTMRPFGIEEIYLFPRNTEKEFAVGFSISHIYQLNTQGKILLQALRDSFTSETHTTCKATDINGKSVRTIGTKSFNFLNDLSRGSSAHHCIIEVPPTLEQRCREELGIIDLLLARSAA